MVLGEVANTKQGNQFYVNVVTVDDDDVYTLAGATNDRANTTDNTTDILPSGSNLVRDMGKKIVNMHINTGAIKTIYKKVQLVVTGSATNEGVPEVSTVAQSFYIKVFPSSKWASITL